MLADAFLRRYAKEAGKKLLGLHARRARPRSQAYAWPGNVRELENRVRRAVVMAEARASRRRRPRAGGHGRRTARPGLRELRAGLERETIEAALTRNRGNISQTAAELGVSRPTLYALLEKLGIER